ncbi:MAG: regulatory protein RecX [Mariprofundus sp.]
MNKEQLAAYHDAIRWLTGREFCVSEMRRRLAGREYDDEMIRVVIDQLQHDGYLSEARYAEAYIRARMNRGEAPWLAAQRARQKGAEAAVVEAALSELTEHYDAEEVARDLVSGRDPGGLRFDDKRVWQRQARFLRNKGFAADIILRVLNESMEDSR